jgi:diaminopimelate decarboxylase
MLELAETFFPDTPPEYIDLGGGFFGRMDESLRKQFDRHVPSYEEYAQAVAPQFAAAFSDEGQPNLILEPGVAIVADVLQFVAKVLDLKTVRGRQMVLTTGSVHNVKPTLHGMNLPMHVFSDESRRGERMLGEMDIVGYTCMEQDCLFEGYNGAIAVGDYLVFDNVGAYTVVLKPPFIRPGPPIIAYDSRSDRFELTKDRESLDDLFRTFALG